ncbi:MAG: hypothetical protein Ct9H300mP16_17640 [Pseudomonadota bacterium]|nr:MAG: hypothetical protein Ct9H300mP16_17640 [Pseudomonadota bacterium]
MTGPDGIVTGFFCGLILSNTQGLVSERFDRVLCAIYLPYHLCARNFTPTWQAGVFASDNEKQVTWPRSIRTGSLDSEEWTKPVTMAQG